MPDVLPALSRSAAQRDVRAPDPCAHPDRAARDRWWRPRRSSARVVRRCEDQADDSTRQPTFLH